MSAHNFERTLPERFQLAGIVLCGLMNDII